MVKKTCLQLVRVDSLMGLSLDESRDKNDRPRCLECVLPDGHEGWHLSALKDGMFSDLLHVRWTTEVNCDCWKESSDICDCIYFGAVDPEGAKQIIEDANKGEA